MTFDFDEWWSTNIGDELLAGKERARLAWEVAADVAAQEEREACAKVCDNASDSYIAKWCADNIRMRSNA